MKNTLWVCTPSGVRPSTYETGSRRAEQITPGWHRVSRGSAGPQWQSQVDATYARVRRFAGWFGWAQAVLDDLIVEVTESGNRTVVRPYQTVITDPGSAQHLRVLGKVPIWLLPRWLDDLAIVVCSGGPSVRPLETMERLAHTAGFLWREAAKHCASPARARIVVHAPPKRERNPVAQGLERVLGYDRLPRLETVPRTVSGGGSALVDFLREPDLEERAVLLVADPADAGYVGGVRRALGRRGVAVLQISPCSKFPGLGPGPARPKPRTIRRAYPRLR